MNELILNNPRGLKLSYAVRLRGSPYLFTDGVAAWSSFDGLRVMPGTLANQDFGFTANADPLDPLDVGTDMAITLVDPGTRELSRYFATAYTGVSTRLAGDYPVASAGNLPVLNSSAFAIGDDIHVGLETMRVTGIPSPTALAVTRAYWDCLPRAHRVQITDDGTPVGPLVSTSPRVFRGRYVEVFVAGVGPDGSAADQYTWWAGRLAAVKTQKGMIVLNCDPLNAAFEQDEWPYVTAGGTLREGTPSVFLAPADVFVVLNLQPSGGANRGLTAQLGYYDSSNTWQFTTANTSYPIPQVITMLAHTVQKVLTDEGVSNTRNRFQLMLGDFDFDAGLDTGLLRARYSNQTNWGVRLRTEVGLGAVLKTFSLRVGNIGFEPRWHFEDSGTWAFFAARQQWFGVHDGTLTLTLDSRWRPFTLTGYDVAVGAPVGFAKISDGERIEIISYTGVSTTGNITELTGVRRGLAGTTAQRWPGLDEDGNITRPDIKVEQLFASSYNTDTFIWQILCPLLMSNGTGGNGPYDLFGEFGGLSIPADFVWYEDLIAKIRSQYFPRVFMFFVTDPGKGRSDLEAWLKMFGIHFVTKRFQRGGVWRYGLTVDIVDSLSVNRYGATFSDTDRKAATSVAVDYNERVVINQVAYKPVYKFGENPDNETTGGMRYVYSEESITDYGAAKPLELRASSILQGSMTYGSYQTSTIEDLQTGIATETALRWFGVYDRGIVKLTVECPHTGWRFQPGDDLLLALTAVGAPNGDADLVDTIGKVIRVNYRTGVDAGATLTLRLDNNNTGVVAWAPSATVANISTVNLTLHANRWTDVDATVPDIPGNPLPNRDGYFFNPATYGLTQLPVVVYDARDYAGTAIYTTVNTFTSPTAVVLATSAAALVSALSGDNVHMTLGRHDTSTSARYRLHMFLDRDKDLT